MAIIAPIEEPDKVKFVYNVPENYAAQYVNGVIGGLTPRGDIVLNFFYENSGLPSEEIDERRADGSMDRILPPQEMAKMFRDVKVGIIIAPHVAGNIEGFIKTILESAAGIKQAESGASKTETETKEAEKDVQ